MTETTQPDPQVVAWMRGYLRDNPAPDDYGASNKATAMRACRQALGGDIRLRDLSDAYLAARKPLTVADIPAGQGPASLFIAPFVGDLRAVYFKAEDGRIARVTEENCMRHEMRVLWEHLAATLRHVTAEDAP